MSKNFVICDDTEPVIITITPCKGRNENQIKKQKPTKEIDSGPETTQKTATATQQAPNDLDEDVAYENKRNSVESTYQMGTQTAAEKSHVIFTDDKSQRVLPTLVPRYHGPGCAMEVGILEKHTDDCRDYKKVRTPCSCFSSQCLESMINRVCKRIVLSICPFGPNRQPTGPRPPYRPKPPYGPMPPPWAMLPPQPKPPPSPPDNILAGITSVPETNDNLDRQSNSPSASKAAFEKPERDYQPNTIINTDEVPPQRKPPPDSILAGITSVPPEEVPETKKTLDRQRSSIISTPTNYPHPTKTTRFEPPKHDKPNFTFTTDAVLEKAERKTLMPVNKMRNRQSEMSLFSTSSSMYLGSEEKVEESNTRTRHPRRTKTQSEI